MPPFWQIAPAGIAIVALSAFIPFVPPLALQSEFHVIVFAVKYMKQLMSVSNTSSPFAGDTIANR
jgi:hypothetical protein